MLPNKHLALILCDPHAMRHFGADLATVWVEHNATEGSRERQRTMLFNAVVSFGRYQDHGLAIPPRLLLSFAACANWRGAASLLAFLYRVLFAWV
jgi:hypothetical protein